MEYLVFGVVLVAAVAAVILGAMSEVGLTAAYARIWARLSGRHARSARD